MVQSIKTEIIYYGMPSDFEFEFNLCGCCQMRLLKETANDTSSLLRALQKGIARSRVIFVIGNTIGENNSISVISKAIGYSCEILDTDFYDIKSTEPIYIIKNSVPLISSDGIFGGCIIESGPQSMIFLTEDKRVRKEIMQNLVNAYISDLSRYQYIPEPEEEQPTDTVEEIEETAEETALEIETAEETALEIETTEDAADIEPEVEEEQETETQVESDDTLQEFEDIMSLSDEADTDEEAYDPYKIENIITADDVDLDETDDYDEEEIQDAYDKADDYAAARKFNIITLILSSILLLLLAFIVYSFIYLPLSNGVSVTDNFTNLFSFLKG